MVYQGVLKVGEEFALSCLQSLMASQRSKSLNYKYILEMELGQVLRAIQIFVEG